MGAHTPGPAQMGSGHHCRGHTARAMLRAETWSTTPGCSCYGETTMQRSYILWQVGVPPSFHFNQRTGSPRAPETPKAPYLGEKNQASALQGESSEDYRLHHHSPLPPPARCVTLDQSLNLSVGLALPSILRTAPLGIHHYSGTVHLGSAPTPTLPETASLRRP